MSYYIGIDIGGMSIKAGVVNDEGKILFKKSCVTRAQENYTVVIKDMYLLCESLIQEAGLTKSDIKAVGMGCPGSVDSKRGIITFAANLNFVNVNIVEEFTKYWDIKCVVNNDANCAALGEAKFGEEKNLDNVLFITIGTGIGTGFIVDGKILEGENRAGAEGGHICIKMGGEKCSCGERGCWEAYASATALLRQTAKAMERHPESLLNTVKDEIGELNGKVPFEAYKRGDKTAKILLKKYVGYIACGLVSCINIFRPKAVMIGGGVSNAGDFFIKMIEDEVKKHVFGGERNIIPHITKAVLGNDAGIVGAAAPVMD